MQSTSRHRSIVHALSACLIAALLTPVIATVAAPVAGAQAWSPPGYVRSFGGRGEAITPWAAQIARDSWVNAAASRLAGGMSSPRS